MLARAGNEVRDRDDELDRNGGIDRNVAALVGLDTPANDDNYPARELDPNLEPASTLYEEFHPHAPDRVVASAETPPRELASPTQRSDDYGSR